MGQWRTIRPLYRAFLKAASEVLVEGGVMVIITVRATAFRDLVFKSRRYILTHERMVEAGGLFPRIFVLRRL